MRNLDFFKNEAVNRNLCTDYAITWSDAKDKQELFDLAMHYNAIRYIALSMYEGWGMTMDYIKEEFAEFINGKKHSAERTKNNLTLVGSMYVDYTGRAAINTDHSHIVGCRDIIISSIRYASQFHLSNNTSTKIELPNKCFYSIYLYDESTIDLGELKEGQKVMVYVYGDVPTEGRINYIDNGGSISIRRRDLQADAYGVTHNNK